MDKAFDIMTGWMTYDAARSTADRVVSQSLFVAGSALAGIATGALAPLVLILIKA